MFQKLWWIFLCFTLIKGFRNSRILITEGDPRALTFYEGPTNVYRAGKILPSVIIKSKRNIGNKNPFDSLEYQKPIWEEDEKLKQYNLDCYSGQACSESIPLQFPDNYEYENSLPKKQPSINVIENYALPKKSDDPGERVPFSVTQAPVKYTMGPSVASIFGSHGLGPHYPQTRRPTVTLPPSTESRTEPPATTSKPLSEITRTFSQPKSYGSTHYDPFVYQQENLKRLSPDYGLTLYEEQPPSYPSLYTDSRVFSPDYSQSYSYKDSVLLENRHQQQRNPSVEKETLRDSLSWKKPNTNQASFSSFNNLESKQNLAIKRATSSQHQNNNFETYFPGQTTKYTTPSPIKVNFPNRSYFPNREGFDDDINTVREHQNEFDNNQEWNENQDTRNNYVGDPTQLNTGIIVGDADDEDILYQWPPAPTVRRKPHSHQFKEKDDDTWLKPIKPYDKDYVPNVTPWTSIDSAKPQWEEMVFSTTSPSPPTSLESWKDPYGKWVGGDMKLTSIPFSRSADGSQRKWIVMAKGRKTKSKLRRNRTKAHQATVKKD